LGQVAPFETSKKTTAAKCGKTGKAENMKTIGTTYTPGPCFISAEISTGYAPAYQVSAPIGAGTQHIATFKRKADAELFCASPELLAALEELAQVSTGILSTIENRGVKKVLTFSKQRAEAAITKAKGL
jgi:hypothetical protein